MKNLLINNSNACPQTTRIKACTFQLVLASTPLPSPSGFQVLLWPSATHFVHVHLLVMFMQSITNLLIIIFILFLDMLSPMKKSIKQLIKCVWLYCRVLVSLKILVQQFKSRVYSIYNYCVNRDFQELLVPDYRALRNKVVFFT